MSDDSPQIKQHCRICRQQTEQDLSGEAPRCLHPDHDRPSIDQCGMCKQANEFRGEHCSRCGFVRGLRSPAPPSCPGYNE